MLKETVIYRPQLRDIFHPILLHLPNNPPPSHNRCFSKSPVLFWCFFLPFQPPSSPWQMCLTVSTQSNSVWEARKLKFWYLNQFYFLPSSLIENGVLSLQTMKQYPCCPKVDSTCVFVILLEIEVLISVYIQFAFLLILGKLSVVEMFLYILNLLCLFFPYIIFFHSFLTFSLLVIFLLS